MRRAIGILGATAVLAGCGHSAPKAQPSTAAPQTVTAAFTPAHMQVSVRVGSHVVVKMSHGECTAPTSTAPDVLAPDAALASGCSADQARFTARRPGTARIYGQLPCAGTACMAMRSWITVTVS